MVQSLKNIPIGNPRLITVVLLAFCWLGLHPTPSDGQTGSWTPPAQRSQKNLNSDRSERFESIPISEAGAQSLSLKHRQNRPKLAKMTVSPVDHFPQSSANREQPGKAWPGSSPENPPTKVLKPVGVADLSRFQSLVWDSETIELIAGEPSRDSQLTAGRLSAGRDSSDRDRNFQPHRLAALPVKKSSDSSSSPSVQPQSGPVSSGDMFSIPPMPEDIRTNR